MCIMRVNTPIIKNIMNVYCMDTSPIIDDERIITLLDKHDENKYNIMIDLDLTLIDTEFFEITQKNQTNQINQTNQKNVLEITHKILSSYYNETRFKNKMLVFLTSFMLKNILHVVYYRKNVFKFLKSISKIFNVYLYTNAINKYTEKITDEITKIIGYNTFTGIISRKSDTITQKTIKIIPDANVYNTIIIDDNLFAWDIYSQNNVIDIRSYNHTPIANYINDDDLITILDLLIDIDSKKCSFDEFIKNILCEYAKYILKSKRIDIIPYVESPTSDFSDIYQIHS